MAFSLKSMVSLLHPETKLVSLQAYQPFIPRHISLWCRPWWPWMTARIWGWHCMWVRLLGFLPSGKARKEKEKLSEYFSALFFRPLLPLLQLCYAFTLTHAYLEVQGGERGMLIFEVFEKFILHISNMLKFNSKLTYTSTVPLKLKVHLGSSV